MKKLLIAFLFIVGVSTSDAQQWMQFSQSVNYQGYTNPAYVGRANEINAGIAHRSQYVKLAEKVIASQYLNFSLPLVDKRLGVGVTVLNDFIGYQRYTSFQLNGAYHLNLNQNNSLSFGLGVGAVQLSLNGSELRTSSGVYDNQIVIHNDELLPNDRVGALNYTLSTGLLYSFKNLDLGIAVLNINSPKLKFVSGTNGTFTDISRTINLHGIYVINTGSVKIQPSFFYKTDFTKHQMQTDVSLLFNNILIGAAFRGYSGWNNDAIIGHFGFKFKNNWSVNYSYDYNVSGLGNSNSGSHEVSLIVKSKRSFQQKSIGNILYTPRFL